VALDIFTCGSDGPALRAFELLLEEFKPKIAEKRIIRRDIFGENRRQDTL
jgi:S-adenosylmethionine/arginine decarboxylase-like enzyme